jgi:hypothetical protein
MKQMIKMMNIKDFLLKVQLILKFKINWLKISTKKSILMNLFFLLMLIKNQSMVKKLSKKKKI